MREFTEHNRDVRLPELEGRRQEVLTELEGVHGEREKLCRWLSGAGLSAQAIGFINNQVDRLSEQEGQVQERLWALEDEIAALQTVTYNSQEICDQLAEFVRVFPSLTDGERRLVVDSLISEVVLKHKEVAVTLTPPLAGLGFLSTSLAPRGIKPRMIHGFIIQLIFNLDVSERSQTCQSSPNSLFLQVRLFAGV